MRNIDFFSIDMYQIQRFLTVADLLSFTKAAQKLNLAQSTVSKSVAQLETTLGLILFIRDKGTVRLTPAGRHLAGQWRRLMLGMELSIEKAWTIQQGILGQITVGIHNLYDISYFFMPIVSRFREKFPQIRLYTKCYHFPDLKSKVMEGSLDAAFTSFFETDSIRVHESEVFHVKELLEFPLTAVMLGTNPLAKKEKITVADLRYQRFIIHAPTKVPAYQKLIIDTCGEHGFTPGEFEYVEDAMSFALSLNDNDQIYVVDRAAMIEEFIHLKTFDLEGTRSGVSLIWRQGDTNPAVKLFIEECDEFFKNNPDPYASRPKR